MASYNLAHEYKQRIEFLTKQRDKIAEILALLSEMVSLVEKGRETPYTHIIRDLGAEDAELTVSIEMHKRSLVEFESLKR